MNKLIIILLALFTISPVAAMFTGGSSVTNNFPVVKAEEKHSMNIQITGEENKKFVKHLSMALAFSNIMVRENKISDNNPIHCILHEFSNDLSYYMNDLSRMIDGQKLNVNISLFADIDRDKVNTFALEQIRNNVGDIEGARSHLVRNRHMLSGMKLSEIYPNYHSQWIGEIKTPERINFMLRNAQYPLDGKAQKDYIALFIYQMILAYQTT
ncbi:MAG TPA: hypothetical protein VKR54_01935 [Candidatus Babeliales bacterium]|jgi:hypothetical protein|nr:hypothetical protein [Candidatus Babeliales bacterium]